jgi:hypothetical protein
MIDRSRKHVYFTLLCHTRLWLRSIATGLNVATHVPGNFRGPACGKPTLSNILQAYWASWRFFRISQADRMYSEAHDDLYQFSFESRRWFPCALRKPRGAPVAHAAQPEEASPLAEGGRPVAGPEDAHGGERGAAGQPESSVGEGPQPDKTVRGACDVEGAPRPLAIRFPGFLTSCLPSSGYRGLFEYRVSDSGRCLTLIPSREATSYHPQLQR